MSPIDEGYNAHYAVQTGLITFSFSESTSYTGITPSS